MISSSEAIKDAKVLILTQKKAKSKFKKIIFKVGDTGYIKAISGDPWSCRSNLIWITKDGLEGSKSFGFRPEDLELIK